MTKVRYIGNNKRIAGMVGVIVEEARHLSLSSGEVALVFFPNLPRTICEWNLRTSDLEAVA